MKQINYIFLIILLGFCLNGCVVVKNVICQYNINKDYSGNVKYSFLEIYSNEGTEAKRKEDMHWLYNEYIPKLEKDMGNVKKDIPLGIKNIELNILNKTENKCDIVLSAEYDYLVMALPFITEKNTYYKIEKKGESISIRINPIRTNEEDIFLNYILSIKYEGEIIENNAHSFDKENNKMEWNLYRLNEEGIYFVLKPM